MKEKKGKKKKPKRERKPKVKRQNHFKTLAPPACYGLHHQ
jgi:hypothetical protein